ncbi:aldo/keto reductase [Mangrovicella endophytica]|uniref:aldo/keto reductase n=1 Tax=Mangrovicella endophytica TaxID=2066697 RepID=UPI000C9DF6D1|nr:aldo/keto reductase [Mangrovicella endophytica]
MTQSPTITLNDGHTMPQLGFGVWQIDDAGAETAVSEALRVGYRSIDSAAIYGNEAGVGRAVANSGLKRDEIFVTTKVFNPDQGYDNTMRAFDESLAKLKLDHVDLYLIHWPAPKKDLYVETWKALIAIRDSGRSKSIGVSNFQPAHLQRLIDETGVVPVLNQIELHPRFQQKTVRAFDETHDIATESWSPLGRGALFDDPVMTAIAEKHGKSVPQIVLRWHLDNGLVVIPKSVTPSRIAENFDLFDFKLDADDLDRIEALDDPNGRIGPNPDTADF